MKKQLLIILGIAILFVSAGKIIDLVSNEDFDYSQLNLGVEINNNYTSKYSYLDSINGPNAIGDSFPADIQTTSFGRSNNNGLGTFPPSKADTVRNMDNYLYSLGFPNANYPTHIDPITNATFTGDVNRQTDAGVTLGRVLFYDRDLSVNHTISCADCHKQEFSFTDTAAFSYGWEGPRGGRTGRNAMNLNHIRFHKSIAAYWDLRATSIENQVWRPMHDAVEMGMSLNPDSVAAGKKTPWATTTQAWGEVTRRIRAKSFYPILFQKAFSYAPVHGLSDTTIDSQRIVMALAQFVRSINSFDSKFRKKYQANTTNVGIVDGNLQGLTYMENLGRALFMDTARGNCQACHTRQIFVSQGGQNNGADGSITATYGFGRPPKRNAQWLADNNTDSATWNSGSNLSIFNDFVGKDSGMGGWKYWKNRRGGQIPNPNDVNDLKTERGSSTAIGFMGRMNVPSLINVAVTAPYFHDGRYKTLEEVINFYSDSVRNSDYNTLSGFLRKIDQQAVINEQVKGKDNVSQAVVDTSPVQTIHYSKKEKAALKAFLLTFTDSTMLTNPKWSNPFLPAPGGVQNRLKPILDIQTFPVRNDLVVKVTNGQTFSGRISLYNSKGKLIRTKKVKFTLGSNIYAFTDIERGSYYVRIKKEG